MWPDPGTYINCSHRHMNVEIGTEGAYNSQNRIHKWDFRCSAPPSFYQLMMGHMFADTYTQRKLAPLLHKHTQTLPYCKEPKTKIGSTQYIFPEKELGGHSPNFHIPHVSVSDSYMWTADPGNIYKLLTQTHECGNWDWSRIIP
jgi:hypothetical protein